MDQERAPMQLKLPEADLAVEELGGLRAAHGEEWRG